jgi:hypothetical protein
MNLSPFRRRRGGHHGGSGASLLLAAPVTAPAAPETGPLPQAAPAPEVTHGEPHGIAAPEVLQALMAEAEEAEARAARVWQRAPWSRAHTPSSPDPAAGLAASGIPWRGETIMDVPVHTPRVYTVWADETRYDLAPPAADLIQVTAAESRSRMGRLAYPPYDAPRGQWAAVMRQVGAYTGTRSAYDRPEAWRTARAGDRQQPVTVWSQQRPALLAIEAGRSVAS